MESTREQDIQRLAELVKDIEFAMLTTVDAEGCLRSRPMATQELEADGTLWFFTELNSGKVAELERDQHVNVSYAAPDDNKYVSVSGTARAVRDTAKAKQLWNPLLKAWFPNGPEDPNTGLLRVDVEKAEYWDAPSSTAVQLIGFAKAIVTGKRYEETGVEHKKIDL